MNDISIVIDDIQPVALSPAQAEDAALQLERDFVEIVRAEIGLTELLASSFAQALVRGLRRRLGGGELWIPAISKDERNEAIRREFNGSNVGEVMKRHRVSRATVYREAGRRPAQKRADPVQPAQQPD